MLPEPRVILLDLSLSEIRVYAMRLMEASDALKTAERSQKNEKLREWMDCLDGVLRDLYERLFSKVLPSIGAGVKSLVLIPFGVLHLLPLHAAFHQEEGGRRYLLDDYLVSYAPSAKILALCKKRQRRRGGGW